MFKVRVPTRISVLFVLAIVAAACSESGTASQPTPTSAPAPEPMAITDQAFVESIEILILESFPVQVHAVVRGQLPDACAFVERAQAMREGNTFRIALSIARRPDARCALVLTPFEHSIALDVVGLKAGTYAVTAGDVSTSFTLSADNILPPAGEPSISL